METGAGGKQAPVTLEAVRAHPRVGAFIRQADAHLAALGFTEHGERHCSLVANIAHNVVARLGYSPREAELAAIAGYTHDIGNVVGRAGHALTGAVLMAPILDELGMPPHEAAIILGAIGNHEEAHGHPVNRVSAALILADKSDVHRTRVRNRDPATFDIHDRVNYAVVRSFLHVDGSARAITLELTIEQQATSVMEYFEIFLQRMIMCRRAAEFLGCRFHLVANGARLA
ncbi:MAG TPA: HD domain-containing protein [Limnochordales bacterium]|nr:HD domain-containing protein [Limnochordales bacterium]